MFAEEPILPCKGNYTSQSMRIIQSFILLIVVLFVYSCRSRQQETGMIHLSAKDSVYRASLISRFHEIRSSIHPDSAVLLLQQIKRVEDQYDTTISKVKYFHLMAFHYAFDDRQPDSVRLYADRQWNLLQSGQLTSGNLKAWAYHTRSIYYMDKEQYDSAINSNIQALSLLHPPIDSTLLLNIYQHLSTFYSIQRNYEKATFYCQEDVRNALRLRNSAMHIDILLTAFANAFPSTNDSLKALGGHYLLEAKAIADSLNLATYDPSALYNNLAYYYAEVPNRDSCLYYSHKAITYKKTHPQSDNQPQLSFSYILNDQIKHKDYRAAWNTFNEMQADTNTYTQENFRAYYLDKYQLEKVLGTPEKALQALEQYSRLRDDISKDENDRQLLNYETRMKELANENFIRAKEYEAKNQRYYIIFLAAITILTFATSIYIYFHKKKKRLLEQRYWQQVQREQEYAYQNQLLEERNRISREMHDDLGSTLTSTLMAVEMVEQFPEQKEHLHLIRSSASSLHQQVNEIIWNLNVQNDNVRSLNNYMIHFAKDFLQQAQIRLECKTDVEAEDKIIPAFQRRVIYLSFKELIHNIVKHARATEVKLYIRSAGHHYHLSVCDNGIGLAQSQQGEASPFKGGGYGLGNISRNISKLYGEVNWKPYTETGGTEVSIDIDIITETNDKNTHRRRSDRTPTVS